MYTVRQGAPRGKASKAQLRFAATLQDHMRGYGIVEIARACDIRYGDVQRIAKGERPPTFRQMLRLVSLFPELIEVVRELALEEGATLDA